MPATPTVRFPGLLVVDDDPTIVRSLRVNLEAEGYEVQTATSGREALEKVRARLPDLAIVDLLLPDMHGFELCRRLKSYIDLPIIMLTAVDTEASVVEGLEKYAEDYIVKPFSYRELLTRVARVLKRTRAVLPQEQVLSIDEGVEVDFARHEALMGKRRVGLTPIESRILAVLARRANQTVPVAQLLDETWPDGEGDGPRLWVNIRRLRRKLEADPDHPQRLVTERGKGYRLKVKSPGSPGLAKGKR